MENAKKAEMIDAPSWVLRFQGFQSQNLLSLSEEIPWIVPCAQVLSFLERVQRETPGEQ